MLRPASTAGTVAPMHWSVLKLQHLPAAPDLGILVARVTSFGQYESGELAHRAMALDEVPTVEHGLVILVRGAELQLRPEHKGREGEPVGALRPPLIDWRASGCRLILPELDLEGDAPAWVVSAADLLADAFLQPLVAQQILAGSLATVFGAGPDPRPVGSDEIAGSAPQKSNLSPDPTAGS